MAKPKTKLSKQQKGDKNGVGGAMGAGKSKSFKAKGKKAFAPKTSKKTFNKKPNNKKFTKEVVEKAKKQAAKDEEETKKRKLEDNDIVQIKKKKKEKSELLTKLMAIYETLRRKNTLSSERTKLINDVIKIAEEKESEIALKHGTVRVLEMCVKYGTDEQKEKIFHIFKENLVSLLTSKYAKFLVEKFIEYGTKNQRKKVIEAFYGKVKKLIKNKDAQSILEEIYCKYANASQKASLVEEFYGPEFAIFKVASGRNLDEILTNEPAKKDVILKYMKETLTNICQKDAVSLSVIHRAVLDFFKYADQNQKSELVEVLKSAILNILHTKDGAKVAVNCLWIATTKERKAITKSFKTHVKKICMEEFGHLVMLSLFDVMDDTVLIKKALFPEILSNLDDLVTDQYGRKVLLYLLKPRCTTFFLPEIVKFLQEGDDNKYSKKDPLVRQQELRDVLVPDLLMCMTRNITEILRNKSHAVTLLAALEVTNDFPEAADLMKSIADIAAKPLKSLDTEALENDGSGNESDEDDEEEEREANHEKEDNAKEHIIIDCCGHYVIKNLVKQDKQRIEKGLDCGNYFSCILCDTVPTGYFADWALHNRGAFVLVSLMESGIESVITRVKKDLKFLKKTSNKIDTDKNKGFGILKKLF